MNVNANQRSPPGSQARRSRSRPPRPAESAEVSWGPAAHHGARISSYLITWSGGGRRTVDGSARQATITGLADGSSYVFTVRATNRVGTGPGRSSAQIRLVPQDPRTPRAG